MGSLDIEALLKGIAPDAPCGEDLEYDADFIALEQKAKGTPEKYHPDGSREEAQPPNWREVRKDVVDLLGRTRDLRLLLELVRANLALEGVAGLREALEVLRGAVENYWDSIHPQLDPDDKDPTFRVNLIEGLVDAESVLRMFLNAPLVDSHAMGRFSLRKIQIAAGRLPASAGEEAPSLATIQAAFTDAAPESLRETRDALEGSLADLNAVERFVTEQVGAGSAPTLTPLRTLLKEALAVLDENLARRGLGGAAAEEAGGAQPQPAAEAAAAAPRPAGAALSGAINSRQDVIRCLDLICDYYAKHEPSSPLPLLMRRARRLATMDFMEILNDLAPNGLAQVELIKGQEAEPK